MGRSSASASASGAASTEGLEYATLALPEGGGGSRGGSAAASPSLARSAAPRKSDDGVDYAHIDAAKSEAVRRLAR